mmetsp:Transcript_3631/g.5275  ORF Transcript_3631/g.5275 Transcript_3631/m.5275 type:complete len:268 (-) Transcript_3631:100-903(-)
MEADTISPKVPIETDDDNAISFVVTGFGRFGNINENPTSTIVNYLESQRKEEEEEGKEQASGRGHSKKISICRIIKTGAMDVTNDLDEITESLKTKGLIRGKHLVFIHFGVNYKASAFQLESTAFNDASFRIPDENGYQPKNIQIDDEIPLRERLSTSLNVRKLCTEMEKKGFDVQVSGDPGRFVCNYLYWSSLNNIRKQFPLVVESDSEESTSRTCVHAIFVHVPPFQVIDEKTQFDFVENLLDSTEHVLLTQRKKKKSKKKSVVN